MININLILLGESACGKSTIQSMIASETGFKKVVTYTTRPARMDEIDGVHYHFITDDAFSSLEGSGFFIEANRYRGWRYGTPKGELLDGSGNRILVLTPAGYRALKRAGIPAVAVYIKVDRRSRFIKLLQRGDDIEEAYRRSLSDVGQFDGIENEVDYVIDNENYKFGKDEIKNMVEAACASYCLHD